MPEPTGRKGDCGRVKRPENAFILFRKQKCEERRIAQLAYTVPKKKIRQAELSKIISYQWKTLSLEERQYWNALAQTKKAWHEIMYPDYVYRPRPRKNRKDKKNNRDKIEEIGTQICFPSAPRSPNNTEDDAPTYATDKRACNAVGPTPPSESRADDLPTIPTLRSPADQLLCTNCRQRETELLVEIQDSSEPSFCSQCFGHPSSLNDSALLQSHFDFLGMEDNYRDDAYMDKTILDDFAISIPETSTILRETLASGSTASILSVLSSDIFHIPLADWNEALMPSTPSTPHQMRREDIPGDIDGIGLSPLPWENYTDLADLVHEDFDWYPELPLA